MYGSPGGTRTFALLSNATNCPLPDILTSATGKSLSIPIAPLPSPQQGLQSRLHLNRSIQHSSFSLIPLTLCNVDLLSALYHIPAFSSCFKTISLLYPSMDSWFSSHVLWIVMLLCAQVSRKFKFLLSPLGSKSWNRIARYYDNPLRNSLRGLHGVFHNCCVLIFPSHPQPTEVLVLPQPPQHLTVSVLSNSSHRDCYKVTACAGSKTCPPPHTHTFPFEINWLQASISPILSPKSWDGHLEIFLDVNIRT